ncbi:MAG: L-seryl-tRNA(Sec) selenium transferase [Chloroflexota bacterium]
MAAQVPGGHPPSVEQVLAAARPETGDRDADAVLAVARDVIATERARLDANEEPRTVAELGAVLLAELRAFDGPGEVSGGDPVLQRDPTPVINATGVIIHTNLGRAAWPSAAIEAARRAAEGAILLEFDRATGRRGARYRAAEEHLIALTGAEDALVVTNNAAAIALAVGLAGRGGGVAVSRGELVEIGGGVRIPEILRRAGVRLVEVGTTNRTRVSDFDDVLGNSKPRIRAILRVHPSNFVQSGFVEAPDPAALSTLAHRHGALVLDDLGSGALLPTERVGLAHEPTPRERLASGADLITFSGDKLIGGPQAGLIVGRRDLIARIRRDPLARAMRPDKTILAAVAATLALYRGGRAMDEIPVWRMLSTSRIELQERASAMLGALPAGAAEVVALEATVGGGSVPGGTIASVGLALAVAPQRSAGVVLARLRTMDPSIVGRIERDRVVLDLRTVLPGDDVALVSAVARAVAR